MFFGYPITATTQNWLHECLVEMVTAIHARLDAGKKLQKWPTSIPGAYRLRLSTKHGLRDRLKKYAASARRLTSAQRAQVLRCLNQQNAIADLVSCAANCECLTDLPLLIQEPAKNLFVFAYGLLTDLELRDQHYAAIYHSSEYHVCPFCCSEYFDAPGAPREDYDHYLASSLYPFAAANLRNLTPMGMKCNERYKAAADILRDHVGNRRRSFDPYSNRQLQLSLINSIPFRQRDGQTPAWKIEFIPQSQECVTWSRVFKIRKRLTRDVLNPSFRHWLADFAGWFVRRKGVADVSDAKIVVALREYAEDIEAMGLTAREFLRGPVFRMLERHCAEGNSRLIQFTRDLVTQAVPQPPAKSNQNVSPANVVT
jgi:hypothetical protein